MPRLRQTTTFAIPQETRDFLREMSEAGNTLEHEFGRISMNDILVCCCELARRDMQEGYIDLLDLLELH